MKVIGLIGGTSWPSTIEYYRRLNELTHARLGGFHSARLLLKSIDYDLIKTDYGAGWKRVPELLKNEINEFLNHSPACIILCNMTLHKAFDMIAHELPLSMPFFHAVDLTAEAAKTKNYRHILLLATKFTMEDGFFARKLEAAGLKVTIPDATERQEIQSIQTELATGTLKPEFGGYFRKLISKYTNCDAVALSCTELPLAVTAEISPLPILNPAELQCRAAVDFALTTV